LFYAALQQALANQPHLGHKVWHKDHFGHFVNRPNFHRATSRVAYLGPVGVDVGGRIALVEQDTRPLNFFQRSRAGARALSVGASTGAVMGLIVAAAYVAGTADAREQHVRISSMAEAASGEFSEVALRDRVLNMDPAALAVARRHDPLLSAGDAQRDRQSALLAARLEKRIAATPSPRTESLLLRASFGGPFNPAAAPYRFNGALDASRDLECLTQAVYYEARGETPDGQAAVAQVVLNRVRHPAFPKSVCAVVFQGAYTGGACQFSFACDGSMRRGREPGAWRRAQKVATRALGGFVMPGVGNATHFHTINVSPGWGPRMIRVQQVGLHIFYRFGGRSGAPGAFGGRPVESGPQGAFDIAQAGGLPGGPLPYEVVSPAGGAVILASAVTEAPADASGVGGPAGRAAEPASAPKAPAEPATASAPKPSAAS
jgi:spore germination cell wall hydrolase CwlJ-like protein